MRWILFLLLIGSTAAAGDLFLWQHDWLGTLAPMKDGGSVGIRMKLVEGKKLLIRGSGAGQIGCVLKRDLGDDLKTAGGPGITGNGDCSIDYTPKDAADWVLFVNNWEDRKQMAAVSYGQLR